MMARMPCMQAQSLRPAPHLEVRMYPARLLRPATCHGVAVDLQVGTADDRLVTLEKHSPHSIPLLYHGAFLSI